MLTALHLALLTLRPIQAPVQYEVAFPNRVHHEAEITATFSGVPAGPLAVRMSRSSPGRYAAHEFAKNVYSVKASDGAGKPLTVTKSSPQEWIVGGHNGTVKVSYTIFADYADGTYAGIDRSHAHLNIPATFMWATGLDARPVQVRFRDLPADWIVATQLKPGPDATTFSAPSLQYFMDSPIEISALGAFAAEVTAVAVVRAVRMATAAGGLPAVADL